MDCSPPGFSIHGVFQSRILGCVAISFSSRLAYCRYNKAGQRISPRGILGSVVQELRVLAGPSAPGGRRSSHLSLDDGVSGLLFTIHSNAPEMRLGPAAPDLSFGEKEEQRLEAEVWRPRVIMFVPLGGAFGSVPGWGGLRLCFRGFEGLLSFLHH